MGNRAGTFDRIRYIGKDSRLEGGRFMTDKEFKRLSRSQLIDIIYQLQMQLDQLTERNREVEEELADKRLRLGNAGNIAEAALEMNNCFHSARNAAEQYLNEIKTLRDETEAERSRILAQARAEAEDERKLLLSQTNAKLEKERDRILAQTKAQAERERERILEQAKAAAEVKARKIIVQMGMQKILNQAQTEATQNTQKAPKAQDTPASDQPATETESEQSHSDHV